MEQQQTMPGVETDLSMACEAVLESMDLCEQAKAEVDEKKSALKKILNERGMQSVNHNGKTFRVDHVDSKDILRISSVK